MPDTATLLCQILSTRYTGELPRGLDRLSEEQWASVVALAQDERVLPTLGGILVAGGLAEEPPVALARFVATSARPLGPLQLAAVTATLGRERNRDLDEQIGLLAEALAMADADGVLLKGAGVLVAEANELRQLTDIDVLIRPTERVPAVRAAMLSLGYRDATLEEYPEPTNVITDEHQLRPMLIPGRAGSVELHRSILQSEYDPLLPADEAAATLVPRGRRLHTLSPEHAALHCIVHAFITDQAYRHYDLSLRAALDLTDILTREKSGGVLRFLLRRAETSEAVLRHSIIAALTMVESLTGVPVTAGCSVVARRRAAAWVRIARRLATRPRLHAAVAHARMVPFAMRVDRMEARVGRPLSQWELAVERVRFLARRTQQARTVIRSG